MVGSQVGSNRRADRKAGAQKSVVVWSGQFSLNVW